MPKNDEYIDASWAFYWREKRLLFLKSPRGCKIFRLNLNYAERLACTEVAFLGPGISGIRQLDRDTVMISVLDLRKGDLSFYKMQDDL